MSLTVAERAALELTETLMAALAGIIGHGPARLGDLAEAAFYVHGIQHMIMSQAAARAHPELYRLLGEDHRDYADVSSASRAGP